MSFLIDSTLKVSLILLAALGATLLLRRRSAAARHWVLAVAIACAAAVPAVGLLVPSWHIGWEALRSSRQVGGSETVVSTTTVVQPLGAPTRGPVFPTPAAAAAGTVASGLPAILALAWRIGILLSLLMLIAGLVHLSRLASSARRVEGGRWVALADEISTAFGLRRRVVLLQSDHPTMLGTWGLTRPKVLLPAVARNWSDARARVVLGHELAHIQRGDWAVQMAAGVLRAVYWFNPLVWIACARLRQESERACDDAVLNGGVDGFDYATHLLDLARTLNAERRAWLPASAMARSSSLKGRISAMLNISVNRSPLTRSARVATILALLTVTMAIAGFAAQSFFTLSGSVLDATNRVLPGTKLVLTNETSQAKHEVRSDRTGHFEFVGLPPGEYSLEVSLPGFSSFKDKFPVIARNLNRTIQLQVGSLEETISVANAAVTESTTPEELARRLEIRKIVDEKRRATLEKCSTAGPDTVGGNIMVPIRLSNARPVYPEHLRTAKIGGVVTMNAIIGEDGNIRDVQAVSSPHPDLESAAIEAVRQWQYTQTLLNCVPIEVRMKVTTRFNGEP